MRMIVCLAVVLAAMAPKAAEAARIVSDADVLVDGLWPVNGGDGLVRSQRAINDRNTQTLTLNIEFPDFRGLWEPRSTGRSLCCTSRIQMAISIDVDGDSLEPDSLESDPMNIHGVDIALRATGDVLGTPAFVLTDAYGNESLFPALINGDILSFVLPWTLIGETDENFRYEVFAMDLEAGSVYRSVAPVPEPGSIALVSAGVAALAARRRRRAR